MPQSSLKKDKKSRMAKYDPENAHAWNVILPEIKKLKANGLRHHEIAKKMGVNKDTVSRWLSEERGGERTTFGAMLRYADALGIPYNKLLKKGELTTESSTFSTTTFDQEVGAVLEAFAKDADLTITDIAKKANLSSLEVNAVFAGKTPATPTVLSKICDIVEVGATMVLKRATKSLEKKREKDTAANAGRTA